MVGGVATAAAVRTFPFRVFSFPTEVKPVWPAMFGGEPAPGTYAGISRANFPGLLQTPTIQTSLTLPFRIDPNIPKDEVWLVKEGRRETLLFHEGPRAGQTMTQWLTNPCIYRIVNFGPPPTLVAKIEPPSLFL